MLYYIFQYLKDLGVPGAGVFQYISFRAGLAAIISLVFATIIGRRIINYLRNKQIGETIRDLGLEGQNEKKNTPTMGGIIIIASILLPVLLLNRLDNVYIILMIVTTLWLGAIGFLDDYIKVFRKNKEGLAGRFKVFGQVGLGVIVAATMYFSDDVKVSNTQVSSGNIENIAYDNQIKDDSKSIDYIKAPVTSVPFFKNNSSVMF